MSRHEEYVGLPHCPVHDARHGGVRSNPPDGKALSKENAKFLPLSSISLRKRVQMEYPVLRDVAQAKGHYLLNQYGQPLNLTPPPATLSSLRLTSESLKVVKGLKKKVVTLVLYLAPDREYYGPWEAEKESGPLATKGRETMCPWATAGCSNACLGHESGNMSLSESQNARMWRTLLYMEDRPLFMAMLSEEIADFVERVHRLAPGFLPAVRLDGTSDLGLAARLAVEFPHVQMYDYSKSYPRMLQYLSGMFPPNWHLTMSYSGSNEAEALDVLARGGNVAVAFGLMKPSKRGGVLRRPKRLPKEWHGYHVLDADKTDVRFQDPPQGGPCKAKGCPAPHGGHIAGLRLKYNKGGFEEALRKGAEFVVRMDDPSLTAKHRGRRLPGLVR